MYGLVWAQVILSVMALFINTFFTGKFLNYNIFQQLKDLFPSIAVATFIGLILWLLTKKFYIHKKTL